MRLIALALSLALSLALAAAMAEAADPVRLHVILPITGSASFLGREQQTAISLIEKQVNAAGGIAGRPVAFAYHDDESKPQTSVQLVTEIMAEHPQVILGPSVNPACYAVAPLLDKGPVNYCFSPVIRPAPGSFVFASGVVATDIESTLIRFFRLKGWTRLALVVGTDATGQEAERGFDEALALGENSQMRFVERIRFNPSDMSVAAQMERVRSAAPQAIIVWTTGAPLATVLKGLIQAGLEVPVAASYGNMTYPQMGAFAGFLPKQLYFPSPLWVAHAGDLDLGPDIAAAQKIFYGAYEAAGAQPDAAAGTVWDPVMTIIDALKVLGPDADAGALHAHLSHLTRYAGVNGLYDFARTPQRGLTQENAVVTRWDADAKRWRVVSQLTGIPLER
jgi:branched-chain amino acid transport system substrate-binding protein